LALTRLHARTQGIGEAVVGELAVALELGFVVPLVDSAPVGEIGILELVRPHVGRVVRRHRRVDPDDDAGAIGVRGGVEAELVPGLCR
jgi:hypothetical protein